MKLKTILTRFDVDRANPYSKTDRDAMCDVWFTRHWVYQGKPHSCNEYVHDHKPYMDCDAKITKRYDAETIPFMYSDFSFAKNAKPQKIRGCIVVELNEEQANAVFNRMQEERIKRAEQRRKELKK